MKHYRLPHSLKIFQHTARGSACVYREVSRVFGARFSARVSVCLEYQRPLYTSDCSAPRSRVMREKIGSGESEVSFRAFLPAASPSEGENYPPACFA